MTLSSIKPYDCARVLHYLAGSVGCVLAIATPSLGQQPLRPTVEPTGQILLSSRAYTPPSGSRSRGGASTGGGVRGCGAEMIALAPAFSNTGQTFSARPTFVWYLDEVPTERLEFTLLHQAATGETVVFSQALAVENSGYQAFTLPTEAPPLQIGETYRWQTTVYCEADSNTAKRWVEAQVEVVEPPRSLALLETVAPTPWQKSMRFARSGYWYEALAQVYEGETAGEQMLRRDLLLDLADLAETADTNAATLWSDRLRAIVETP